jgi:RNA polymerase sigma-70 factor (ECF subfamily)
VNDRPKDDRLSGFVDGDREVWRAFLGEQIPQLYGMFMKRWPNRGLAEELVQQTVFDAVRGRKGFDADKGSPEEWLRGIARNNIRLEMRKRASRGAVKGETAEYLEAVDGELVPDEIIEREETAECVRGALERMESKEAAALRAKYVEGLSARQIAEEMGVTEKAVHSLLYRARNSLRDELKETVAAEREERKK